MAVVCGMALADVEALIECCTEGRTLGVLGELRVYLLALNLAFEGEVQ